MCLRVWLQLRMLLLLLVANQHVLVRSLRHGSRCGRRVHGCCCCRCGGVEHESSGSASSHVHVESRVRFELGVVSRSRQLHLAQVVHAGSIKFRRL